MAGHFITQVETDVKLKWGVLLKRELAESVLGCWQVSKGVIVVKIAAKPVGLNILQFYAPATIYSDSEIDEFYEEVDQVRRQCRAGRKLSLWGI